MKVKELPLSVKFPFFQHACLYITAVGTNSSKLSLHRHPFASGGTVAVVMENIVRTHAFIGRRACLASPMVIGVPKHPALVDCSLLGPLLL